MSSDAPEAGVLASVLFDCDRPGDEAALWVDERSWTWDELRDRADAVAAALDAAGVSAGQAVGVQLANGVDLVAALFGVWRAGCVYVPLNPRLTDSERRHVLATVAPAALIVSDEAASDGEAGDGSGWRLDLVTSDQDRGGEPVRTYDGDVALVQFTSGTTGRPKAVQLRHSGVLTLLDGVVSNLRAGTGRSGSSDPGRTPMPNLIPVSLSLWAGIYNVVFAFRVGAAAVVLPRFTTEGFVAAVRRHQIRSTVLPPAAMTMLADDPSIEDLSPLRYVRSITAPLSPIGARRFRQRFDTWILNCYGQTEIGGEIVGWSAADAREHGDDKLGAVGRPNEGVSARVNADGELEVRTPAMSAGYVGSGAEGLDLGDRLTDDGWFRTGDHARIDDDGFIWIEGRVSDMVNRGGLKVFPAEVEEVLRLHPSVADAAVVGVADDRLGEVPWAFVVEAEAVTDDVLAAHCRVHLAPYKVPAGFRRVAALPRNEVGKVLKGELVESLPASDATG